MISGVFLPVLSPPPKRLSSLSHVVFLPFSRNISQLCFDEGERRVSDDGSGGDTPFYLPQPCALDARWGAA